ncbi:unnamed protein product [Chondrus crispus]|uniref:Uncharacterized protein n=1 Tax=Chondrus crispus TaxID=2769 RepID=R7Q2J0_CHOCR|nr:unnamed protein product [Chondrus crispus]CDF32802.1 unnamed protein product [Chondrus crispus]|eukprot:XP_005712603.1 unnamed protein product [Chondrus crispus]
MIVVVRGEGMAYGEPGGRGGGDFEMLGSATRYVTKFKGW